MVGIWEQLQNTNHLLFLFEKYTAEFLTFKIDQKPYLFKFS